MNNRMTKILTSAGCAIFLGLASVNSQAAGFAIAEQSVSGLGNAFAGGAASASDASTVWFNPAGMMKLKGDSEMVGALHIVSPSAEFTGTGTDAAAQPLTGGDGGDGGVLAVVPNVYYVTSLQGGGRFGLGINAPFGLSTEYDDDWQGRYHGIESGLQTLNINPSIALPLSKNVSLGGGVSVQYASARLTNALDTPAICENVSPALPCSITSGNLPQSADALAEFEGAGWGLGFNLGLMIDAGANTRVGIAYRSAMRHRLSGEADYTGIPVDLQQSTVGPTGNRALVDTDITTMLTTPATFSVSAFSAVTPTFEIMADATWTGWNALDELLIHSRENGLEQAGNPPKEEFNWANTWRFSVGAGLKVSDTVKLRAGLAYDESPIDEVEKRNVRLPGADRTWIALGAGFKAAKGLDIDVGFAHVMMDEAKINRTSSTGSTLTGEFDFGINVLSVQGSWTF